MRANVFRRTLAFFSLYIAVLLSIVVVQFARRTGFTLTAGSMAVSGRYASSETAASSSGARALSGSLSVFFGGMEFRLAGDEGFAAVGADGAVKALNPVSMETLKGELSVRLSDGGSLRFQTSFTAGAEALRVTLAPARSVTEVRLPFRPLRSSRVADTGKGEGAIISGGETYSFTGAAIDAKGRSVVLKARAPSFAYGKAIQKKGFSPADFTSAQAADKVQYERTVQRWRDSAYAGWERSMAGEPGEDAIVSYVAESARRGTYRSAVATTPKTFLEGAARGYRSAPFFGQLDGGLRTLAAAERETLSRLSRMANERDLSLFAENDLVAYLSVRASRAFSDGVADFARSVDPALITPTLAVGFLECWADWKIYRGTAANPFDRLVDQSHFVLGGALRRAEDGSVMLVADDRADAAFVLRAGQALIRSAELAGDRVWADLGRTVVLSAIGFADQAGSLPAQFSFPSGAAAPVPAGEARLPSAAAGRFLAAQAFLPHAIPLAPEGGPVSWTWTAASSVSITESEASTLISVDFPVGETHYMLVRGVKPFQKIQLYGIDFRTDPRFERYDSSGWAYSESEQTLMLKMKHKSTTEIVGIFY